MWITLQARDLLTCRAQARYRARVRQHRIYTTQAHAKVFDICFFPSVHGFLRSIDRVQAYTMLVLASWPADCRLLQVKQELQIARQTRHQLEHASTLYEMVLSMREKSVALIQRATRTGAARVRRG